MDLRRILCTAAVASLVVVGTALPARAQTQTQTVDANINSALALAIDVAFSPNPWLLNQGTNTNPSLVLRAFANVPYALRVNCDSAANKAGSENNLFEFDAGAYIAAGRMINANLQIHALGAGGAVDILPTAVGDTLVNAGAQAVTAAGGRTHTVELSQFVDFGDQALTGTAMYHMVITYTIIAGAV